jgi:hypothetical protein
MSVIDSMSEAYQEKIAGLEAEIERLRRTLQVIADNPGWLDHHCRAHAALNYKVER